MSNIGETDLRLPLDLLLINDVETLESALESNYALEFECEISFFHTKKDLEEELRSIGDQDHIKWYKIDEIENDRIKAVIDLLNMAEENNILGHILDRIVR